MRKVYLCAIFIVFSNIIYAQDTFISTVNYSTFRMKDMKWFAENIMEKVDLFNHVSGNFPAYWTYSFSFVKNELNSQNIGYGFTLKFGSTGSLLYRADYSGQLTLDLLCRYLSLGLPFLKSNTINGNDKFEIMYGITPTVDFSILNMDYDLILPDASESNKDVFNSKNISADIFLILSRKIPYNFSLLAKISYNQLLYGGKVTDTETNGYLIDDSNDKMVLDWSGISVGIGVGYQISF